MFPLFSSNASTSQSSDLGEGIIKRIVYPNYEWRVEFRASYWTARSLQPLALAPGDLVRVVGCDNITLFIEPFAHSERQ